MPARHTLHVALTQDIVDFVRGEVSRGEFPTASEVVRSALQDYAGKRAVDGAAVEKAGDDQGAERDRLAALHSYGILDTLPEPEFDDVVALARTICDVPIALVSLVDAHRQWFKAKLGVDVPETPIDTSVCALAIQQDSVFVIDDLSADPRTAHMSLVTQEPSIRFYAGVPLVMSDGYALGSLCVIDTVARPGGLTPQQTTALAALGRQVVSQIELRTAISARDRTLLKQERRRERAARNSAVLHSMMEAQRQVLRAGGDFDAVLQALVDAALEAVRPADGVVVETRDADDLVYRAIAGVSADRLGFRAPIAGSLSGRCLEEQTTLVTEDADRDKSVEREIALAPGIGAMIVVPLSRHGETFGVLRIRSSEKASFQERHILIAQMLAGIISASFTESAEQAALRAAQESQENYRHIVDSAIDNAIISTSIEGRITSWSAGAEAILGWTEAEILGQSLETIFTPDDQAAGRAAFEMGTALKAGSASDERWHQRKDGGRFWAKGQVTPLLDDKGAATGFVKVLRDRTDQRLATESLRDSEARIRLLLDSMVEGFYVIDCYGTTTLCNQSFLRMMGFEREEDAVGRKLHDVIHHSHPDGTHYGVSDCPIYQCARTGTPAHVAEELFFPIDGRPGVPVEYWAIPMLRDGKLEGAICTFLDITDRKAANDARSRVEERLRELNADLEKQVVARALDRGTTWQVSQDLLAVLNAEGYLESTNPAWQRVLGWSEEELRASPYTDFVHADDLPASNVSFSRIKLGEPVVRHENRYRQANGGYRWISWVAVPENDKFYCRGRDITAEKQQAEDLADRTAERDRLWRNSQDLFAVIDTQGVFKDVSPVVTKILGWSPKEMIGCTVFDFVHPDDQPSTVAALDHAAAEDLPTYENRYRHKDGSYRWMSWVAAPDGDLIFATARHITAEKEAAEQLRQAEDALRQAQKVEAIGQLTGGVAHDFNNLLTVIRGSVDLLRSAGLTEERRARYLDAIADTSERAVKLTSQLLAFARRSSLQPATFDVGGSIKGLRDMIGTLTGSMINLEILVPEIPCFISADPSQFDTALVNMAINARDAMDRQGDIRIAVKAVDAIPPIRNHPRIPGAFVAVSISDTGVGIPEERIGQIFEPFFTTKGVGEGTGLGLSQVFGFSKQSGGEILVESTAGEGTTFTLFLPRVPAPATPSDKVVSMAARDTRRMCILVVEDNADVGGFATQALAELGHRAVLAPNGEDALTRLAENGSDFDAVFTDVVMPGMTGIELGLEIKLRYPAMPVLLTSGYSDVLAQEGTHGFALLQKPYSIDELSRALERIQD